MDDPLKSIEPNNTTANYVLFQFLSYFFELFSHFPQFIFRDDRQKTRDFRTSSLDSRLRDVFVSDSFQLHVLHVRISFLKALVQFNDRRL